jgi:hypothetical protein
VRDNHGVLQIGINSLKGAEPHLGQDDDGVPEITGSVEFDFGLLGGGHVMWSGGLSLADYNRADGSLTPVCWRCQRPNRCTSIEWAMLVRVQDEGQIPRLR